MGLDTSSNQNVLHTLASLQIRTFPLQPNSKVPPKGESWLPKVAIRDYHDWSSGNLAVATGDNLVVLDFDNKPDRNGMAVLAGWDLIDRLPRTFRVRTPSGGVHVYFWLPEGVTAGNSQSKIAPGVDVRGQNGYVVAPGSVIDGRAYEVVCDAPPAPLPDDLLALIPPPPERVTLAFDVEMDTDANIARATNYLQHHAPEAIEGRGGDLTTFKVACRVKDLGVSEGMCHQLMLEHWNDERASPPWPLEGLADKVSSAYRNGSLPPGVATPEADAERLPPEDVERILDRSQTLAERAARETASGVDRPGEGHGAALDLGTAGASDQPLGDLGQRWTLVDPSALPRTRFLYGNFFARGYTSLTIAAPKVGKSLLTLAECVDMATGRHTLLPRKKGDPVPEATGLRVAYFNAEDEMATLQARVIAALAAAGATQADLGDRLSLHSGVDGDPLHLVAGEPPVVVERQFARLERWIARESVDVLVLDPLQDLSAADESNMVFRVLGQRLRRLAAETSLAIGLVHHTRKVEVGRTPVIDDGRGGSALRGTSRFNRVLVAMTEDEGADARIGEGAFRRFFRIGDVESNLAPPSAAINRWFEKHEVDINPGGERFPMAAIRGWEWPDAADGVSAEDAAAVIAEWKKAEDDGDPYRAMTTATRWAGHAFKEVLAWPMEDKAEKKRAQLLIQQWIGKGWAREFNHEIVKANRTKAEVKCIGAGPDDPVFNDLEGVATGLATSRTSEQER